VSEGFSWDETLLRQPGIESHFLGLPSLKAQKFINTKTDNAIV